VEFKKKLLWEGTGPEISYEELKQIVVRRKGTDRARGEHQRNKNWPNNGNPVGGLKVDRQGNSVKKIKRTNTQWRTRG